MPTHYPGVLTWTLQRPEALTLRAATDAEGARIVEREAMMLVEVRRHGLGVLAATVPRHAGIGQLDGAPASLAGIVSGSPGRPRMASQLNAATAWLRSLQLESGTSPAPTTWGAEVLAALAVRAGDLDPDLVARADRLLRPAAETVDRLVLPRTTVHGDLRPCRMRFQRGQVSGVVDWARAEVEGSPLRDAARLAITSWGPRGPHAADALGGGWLPQLARTNLCSVLEQAGAPVDLWYAVMLLGLAELVVEDRDPRRASSRLVTLLGFPPIDVVRTINSRDVTTVPPPYVESVARPGREPGGRSINKSGEVDRVLGCRVLADRVQEVRR